ncbi:MAG TPA: hypothetical protein PK280_10930 [Planctomycetota bacterium]|nr:hypothetical protein [Planctomycetota bacterium]
MGVNGEKHELSEAEGQKFLEELDVALAAGRAPEGEHRKTLAVGLELREVAGRPGPEAAGRLRQRVLASRRGSARPLLLVAAGLSVAAAAAVAVLVWRTAPPSGGSVPGRLPGGSVVPEGPMVLQARAIARAQWGANAVQEPDPSIHASKARMPDHLPKPVEDRLLGLLGQAELVVAGKVSSVESAHFKLAVAEIWLNVSGQKAPQEIEVACGAGSPKIETEDWFTPDGLAGKRLVPAPKVDGDKVLMLGREAKGGAWLVIGELSDLEPGKAGEYAQMERDFLRAWCRLRGAEGEERRKLLLATLGAPAEKSIEIRAAVSFAAVHYTREDAEVARVLLEALKPLVAAWSEIHPYEAGHPPSSVLFKGAAALGRCADRAMVERITKHLESHPDDKRWAWLMIRAAAEFPSPEKEKSLPRVMRVMHNRPEYIDEAHSAYGVIAAYGPAILPRLGQILVETCPPPPKEPPEPEPSVRDDDPHLQPDALAALRHNEYYRADLAAAIAESERTPVAIPYLLIETRRAEGGKGLSQWALRAALAKHLVGEPPGPARREWHTLRGEEPGSAAAALPRRLELWTRVGTDKQVEALRGLPKSEFAVFESFFRSLWGGGTANHAYDRAVALRACALALAARGGAKADPEFVVSLQSDLKVLGGRAPDLGARLARLGSENFAAREAEFKALSAMGKRASPYVQAALASKDPEVRERGRLLAEAIGPLDPDLEPELRLALRIIGAEPEAGSRE